MPTTVTIPTVAAAKTSAERTRPARRLVALTGSVRRYVSHGVVRAVAIPTPNWKNVTVRSAVAAKPASIRSGSPRSNRAPKRTIRIAGKASVGRAYAG